MSLVRRLRASLAVVASLAIIVGLGWAAAGAQTETGGPPRVEFRFDRPGLPVPRYTITVLETGDAVYEGEEVQTAPSTAASTVSKAVDAAAGRPFRSAVKVSPATTKRIFSTAKSLKNFNVPCESRAKNVANTGKKTLSFSGPEGQGECTYNFSENKAVNQLTDTFLGMAETMDEGRQLEHLHRYDRLGLDAAMTTLAEEVSSGRALEVGTIAGTLRSIAADTELIQRVRMRASQLLSLLPPEMQRASP